MTTLASILSRFPHARLARPEDGEELLALLRASPMESAGLALRYERGPDFFRFLRYHGPGALTFVFERDDRTIGGVAALCPRRGWMGGAVRSVAYATELRIAADYPRALRREWHAFYAALLEHAPHLDEAGRPEAFYGAILGGNARALRSLARPGADVVYAPLAPYHAVLVQSGKLHLPELRRARHEVSTCTPGERAELESFLASEHRDTTFGYDFPDELARRLRDWDGLALESFLLVRDRAGQIVACAAPWRGEPGRRLVVEAMPASLRALAAAVRWAGGRSLGPGDPIHLVHLTHLTIARALPGETRGAILRALVRAAIGSPIAAGAHAISLLDFDADGLRRHLGGMLRHATPGTLFRVHHRAHPPIDLRPQDAPRRDRTRGALAFDVGLA